MRQEAAAGEPVTRIAVVGFHFAEHDAAAQRMVQERHARENLVHVGLDRLDLHDDVPLGRDNSWLRRL
jgi:hypothetical protein